MNRLRPFSSLFTKNPAPPRRARLAGIAVSLLFSGLLPSHAAIPTIPPPEDVQAAPQDRQAVRIRWKRPGPVMGYRLYAAYDRQPMAFHQENPVVTEESIVWDAPRSGPRRFCFYVTSVAKNGNESAPSPRVCASLDVRPQDVRPSLGTR